MAKAAFQIEEAANRAAVIDGLTCIMFEAVSGGAPSMEPWKWALAELSTMTGDLKKELERLTRDFFGDVKEASV